VLVPRSSGTPVATWAWPTWVVSQRRVLEVVFILLESPSPSRRTFIGSHSLPPSLVRHIGPSGGAAQPPFGGDGPTLSQPTPDDGLVPVGARPPSRRARRPPSPACAARCLRGERRCNFASPLLHLLSLFHRQFASHAASSVGEHPCEAQ
jgi:hypothetical protein